MKDKLFTIAQYLHPTRISAVAAYLLKDEAISGKLILIALLLALIAANTPFAPWYEALFHSNLTLGIADWTLSMDLRHWINEGLMAFFFLVVGLELKRELVHGELRHKDKAVLPLAAAIGGMIVPALIFIAFNFGRETIDGWAIPTATDIALAVGILALLGDRVPPSIRIFLLALAIVDDIIAVTIIAVFYSTDLNIAALISMSALAGAIYWYGKFRTLPMWAFAISGVVLWLLTLESGIHPSIAGAILGLIAPIAGKGKASDQVAERAEKAMIPFTTLIVVPLFAFANTGIALGATDFTTDVALSLGGGIIAGLVIGKFLGIVGASWLMVKLGFARLPAGARWEHIAGIGFLAGIGFTVAIFVTDLAYSNPEYVMISKISIIIASALAGIIGLVLLRKAQSKT